MEAIQINGIQQTHSRFGQGTPMVLIHGYPFDHTIWYDMVPFLENDFELLLPDLRGFGLSGIVESQYTIADMASDIAGLLDHLDVEKAYIAGHSMGGYIALAFAQQYPKRILGLGLVSTRAVADTPEQKQGRYAAAEEILRSGVQPVAESMPAKLTPDERVQAFVRSLIAAQRPAGLAGALKAMAEREDTTSILSSFKFPVAIVHGKADEMIPIQRAQEIKAVIPHATLMELSGVGHMPMMENPQATATALKSLR
jgi:3-oxoadipate enol-lactonase